MSPGGGIGRRKGLKPPRLKIAVRVRFPSWAHKIQQHNNKGKTMKKTNNTRQEATDLILLANKMLNNSSPSSSTSLQELLLILSESNLTLVPVDAENTLAEFAIQLLDDPSLEAYDASIEITV